MKCGNGYSNSYLMENSEYNSIISYEECVCIWEKAKNELSANDAINKAIRRLGLTQCQNKRAIVRGHFNRYKKEVKKCI